MPFEHWTKKHCIVCDSLRKVCDKEDCRKKRRYDVVRKWRLSHRRQYNKIIEKYCKSHPDAVKRYEAKKSLNWNKNKLYLLVPDEFSGYENDVLKCYYFYRLNKPKYLLTLHLKSLVFAFCLHLENICKKNNYDYRKIISIFHPARTAKLGYKKLLKGNLLPSLKELKTIKIEKEGI